MGRTRRWSLLQALQDGGTAVVVVDSDRRIRMVNAGMEQLSGWTGETLTGHVCDRGAPAGGDLEAILACSIAPPADVWDGAIDQQNTVIPHRNGSVLKVRLCFVPLLDDDTRVVQVLIALQKEASSAATVAAQPLSQQLHAEIQALRLELRRRFQADSFVGKSAGIQKTLRQAELVARGRVSFLVTGPSGSGRRHLARLIYQASGSAEESLAVISCPLLSSEQLLSTFHQLRNLTTAKPGLPHQRLGMLLLAEVEQLPMEAQLWLLKNHDFSNPSVWVAATSQLDSAMIAEKGYLHPDLLLALTTVTMQLPPLHARGSDVLLLSQQFISESRRARQTLPESLSAEFGEQLLAYRWPGNVRELRSVIDASCRTAAGAVLQPADLPLQFRLGHAAQRQPQPVSSEPYSLEDRLQAIEVEWIESMLHACKGNKTECARRLGLTRPKLYRRMKLLGLEDGEDMS